MFEKIKNVFVNEKKEGDRPEDLSDSLKEAGEAAERRTDRAKINEMLGWAEAKQGGVRKEKPTGFEEVPGSLILERSTEELRMLFLIDGVVDFHGNENARQYIGAGDLFPYEQKFLKINEVVGKRSVFNGKVGYLTKDGEYLPIYGGEGIDLEVSEAEQQGFENIKDLTEEEEKEAKDKFQEQIKREEKALEEMRQEMRELLAQQGVSLEEIENLGPEDLFKRVGKLLALKVEETYGIPWQVTLAQSSLESGNGRKALGNNFFGIKAMGNYSGKTQEFLTTEYFDARKEVATKMVDKFRAYDSIADSFNDYGRFLRHSSRYAGAFEFKDDPKKFLETIIAAGYATDPNYIYKAEQALGGHGYAFNEGDNETVLA